MDIATSPKQDLYQTFTSLVEDLSLTSSNMNLIGTQAALNNANEFINEKIKDLHEISRPSFNDTSVGTFESSYSRHFKPLTSRYAGYQACDYDPGLLYFSRDLDQVKEGEDLDLANLSKASEHPDLGYQLQSLLVTLDRLIQFRVGLSNKALKKDGLAGKLDDSVIERNRAIYEDSLAKLTEVISTLVEPLSDHAKKIIYKEIKSNDQLTNVFKYLTQKIPKTTVKKLAPLLGLDPKIHKPARVIPKKNGAHRLPDLYVVEDPKSGEEKVFLLKAKSCDMKNPVKLRMLGNVHKDGTARFEPVLDEFKHYVAGLNKQFGKKQMGSSMILPIIRID